MALSRVSRPREAEPTFPVADRPRRRRAGLLSPEDHATSDPELAALEEKSTDQLVVVTLESLQGYPIEDYGYQLGRNWGIGQKGKNNGVLLIVAPTERKVRIEVATAWSRTLTDALSSLIVQNAILPRFRAATFPAASRPASTTSRKC